MAYREDNARKTNSKKFPDGYIYILKLDKFDLYKIGVSNKPKRRIRDIKSVLPFDSRLVFCRKFKDVYSLESQLHHVYKNNKQRKEWFMIYNNDINELISILDDIYVKEGNCTNQLTIL